MAFELPWRHSKLPHKEPWTLHPLDAKTHLWRPRSQIRGRERERDRERERETERETERQRESEREGETMYQV